MVIPIKVVLVDDHTLMRGGVRSILSRAEHITVIGEAEDGREAVALASKLAPDMILIDIAMPGLNGVEATRKIHAVDPKIAVIALSMHSDERYVTGILDAGGRGYLLKTCSAEELIRAMDAVMRGGIYVTADLTHVLIARMNAERQGAEHSGTPHLDSLTPREREVLQLIAEGLTSKEISARLGTALKTIETHRTNIIRKLDLHSIAELTKYAIREGLTGLSH
ncbi:MAG: response regulator transcription factor [Phycisphaerales bacterium]|nr:response regulator transcription factor [Planctomycetota bacterium]MCH8509046.1 response regulator transcription factor [Phycisphaerales bacterium]